VVAAKEISLAFKQMDTVYQFSLRLGDTRVVFARGIFEDDIEKITP
jgi:hypothetical protein